MTPVQALRRATGARIVSALPDGSHGRASRSAPVIPTFNSRTKCRLCGITIRDGKPGRLCAMCSRMQTP